MKPGDLYVTKRVCAVYDSETRGYQEEDNLKTNDFVVVLSPVKFGDDYVRVLSSLGPVMVYVGNILRVHS